MNQISKFNTKYKIILSILLGVGSLLFSPYGIVIVLEQVKIDIPWSQLFPILVSMSFGWRYGLLSGMSGGAFFPFILWPEDGWANVTTSLAYVILYSLLGVASDLKYLSKIKNVPFRILFAVVIYVLLNYLYDAFLFNKVLELNPSFWNKETVRHIEQEIIYGFAFKDSINVIALTLASETLLRVPFIRKLFGIQVLSSMHSNTQIFLVTLFIPLVVWLVFIGMGHILLRGANVLSYEHKSFALIVILANGFFVSRILFYYNETKYAIQNILDKTEKKFQTIFENVQDVFYQTDLDGKVFEISPSIESLSAYTRDEIIGKEINQLYTDENLGEELLNVKKSGEIRDLELRLRTKMGEIRHVSVNARLIKDKMGMSNHIDGVIRDVTIRKNHELEIEQKNKKLESQNKELEQFTYITSHDLQEPLKTLISLSGLMKKEYHGKLDEQADQYIDFINQSSVRMRNLVKALLDYSRIGIEIQLLEVDCNELVNEVLVDLSFSINESGAKVMVYDLPKLKAYPIELRQLFQNLISNAIKFRQKELLPEIHISAKKEKDNWHFAIKDNGIGIEKNDLEKVFIIFKRLHNRIDYEGTGIGLAYCKKIVSIHGGNIWIESKIGEGSMFHFTIPII